MTRKGIWNQVQRRDKPLDDLKYAKEIIKEFVDIANHYNKGFSPPLVSEELVKKAEKFINKE